MKILYFCPLWGSEHLPFNTFCQNVKHTGYDGVEMSLPLEKRKKSDMLYALDHAGLALIGQHYETTEPDFEKHKVLFKAYLENLADSPAIFINSQTGKDYYSFAQNSELINIASDIAAKTGKTILHETHRGKFSFAVHIMHEYLQKLPDIRITLDASHWCNVAESFLADQPQAMYAAIDRTDHIHARVGFEEGPQVTDPEAPEWQKALEIHASWWDRIVEKKRAEGRATLTITCEFGAPPYLTLLPYTKQPIAVQWDINVFMMKWLKRRYSD